MSVHSDIIELHENSDCVTRQYAWKYEKDVTCVIVAKTWLASFEVSWTLSLLQFWTFVLVYLMRLSVTFSGSERSTSLTTTNSEHLFWCIWWDCQWPSVGQKGALHWQQQTLNICFGVFDEIVSDLQWVRKEHLIGNNKLWTFVLVYLMRLSVTFSGSERSTSLTTTSSEHLFWCIWWDCQWPSVDQKGALLLTTTNSEHLFWCIWWDCQWPSVGQKGALHWQQQTLNICFGVFDEIVSDLQWIRKEHFTDNNKLWTFVLVYLMRLSVTFSGSERSTSLTTTNSEHLFWCIWWDCQWPSVDQKGALHWQQQTLNICFGVFDEIVSDLQWIRKEHFTDNNKLWTFVLWKWIIIYHDVPWIEFELHGLVV